MSKFRIKMKLEAFELEVEGTREDMPLITRNLGQQMSNLLQPSGAILEGRVIENKPQVAAAAVASEISKKKRVRRGSTSVDETDAGAPIDWRHDPDKYGTPKQTWKTSEKAIWLLHVVAAETNTREMSGRCICDTFNKHFRQAGPVTTSNVNRDLGVLKVKKGAPPPVSEDTTQDPPRWYLTEEGQRRANELVADALGRVLQ